MKTVLITAFLLISAYAHCDEWKGPYDHGDFPEAFEAGKDTLGRPLYIGMTFHTPKGPAKTLPMFKEKGSNLAKPKVDANGEGDWTAGQLSHHERGLIYTYDQRVHHAIRHVMFAPENPSNYRWVRATDGDVPTRAVRTWASNPEYICRALWAGALMPGRLVPDSKICLFSFGGIEKAVFVYEVLVDAAR